MTENTALISYQSLYVPLCNHVIQVTSWSSTKRDSFGKAVLDGSTTRQYRCLLQINDGTKWGISSATDNFPYVAYVLSVPINGEDAVPIRVEEQVTVVTPSYWASETPRRLGKIQSYSDEHGNHFAMVFTFE